MTDYEGEYIRPTGETYILIGHPVVFVDKLEDGLTKEQSENLSRIISTPGGTVTIHDRHEHGNEN